MFPVYRCCWIYHAMYMAWKYVNPQGLVRTNIVFLTGMETKLHDFSKDEQQ